MHVGRFLTEVRRLSDATNDLIPRLDLPDGQYALNVHSYALAAYEAFLHRWYDDDRARVGAVAMNPGRNGAVQTGIPFSDLDWARRVVPDLDARLDAPPRPLPPGHRETSGRRLIAWAERRFATPEAMYDHVLFYITCPLAILAEDPVRNVPIPELRVANRRLVDRLVVDHLPRLVEASGVSGILLLGRYAESVWDTGSGLDGLPLAHTYHPAAHVSNDDYFASMDAAFDDVAAKAL